MKNVYTLDIAEVCELYSALTYAKILLEREIKISKNLQKTGCGCKSVLENEMQHFKCITKLAKICIENTKLEIVGD